MAHLIFRCPEVSHVITTGVKIDPDVFRSLHTARTMRCRFCGREHQWEAVERAPEISESMSLKAEGFLRRAVQDDAHAASATDPDIRVLYERMASQWFQLAIECEDRAEAIA